MKKQKVTHEQMLKNEMKEMKNIKLKIEQLSLKIAKEELPFSISPNAMAEAFKAILLLNNLLDMSTQRLESALDEA